MIILNVFKFIKISIEYILIKELILHNRYIIDLKIILILIF